MPKLFILGPAEIRNEDDTLQRSFLAGPKRLALLVYLLLSRPYGFHRRDSLLPVFWPDQGQKDARNALSNLIYHIRNTLGNDVIINRGNEELKLLPEFIWSDVSEFEFLAAAGKYEEAITLYRDDLLKGFFVPQVSPAFEIWLDGERNRLKTIATDVVWKLSSQQIEAGNLDAAEKWARKAVSINFLCEENFTGLIKILKQKGARQTALELFDDFRVSLEKEWDEYPSPQLVELIQSIKASQANNTSPEINSLQEESVPAAVPESNSSLAILPFESLGSAKATAFTDAVHSDLLTRIASMQSLHVISRNSVLRFRNDTRPLPAIASELKVKWILSGEVQQSEDQIKVNVRLIDAFKDRQMWAQDYNYGLSTNNIFKIQEDIASRVVGELGIKLLGKNEGDPIPTQNLEAYCLNAEGRWHIDQRTGKGISEGIQCFRKALQLDDQFALAWVGLADALNLQQDYGYATAEEVIPQAEAALAKAFELKPGLPEAAVTSVLLKAGKKNLSEAVDQMKATIVKNPGYADAHNWLAWIMLLEGNAVEALEHARISVQLNPLSAEAISNLASSWLANGQYEQALQTSRRIINIQKEWTTGYFYEGLVLYHQQEFFNVWQIMDELLVPWAGNGPLIIKGMAGLKLGKQCEVQKITSYLQHHQDHSGLGLLAATAGNKEQALIHFGKAASFDYWELLAFHHLFPKELDALRQHPVYQKMMRKLKQEWGIRMKSEVSAL